MLTLLCLAFIDEATSSPIKPPPIIRMFFEIFILDFNNSHSLIFRKYIISLSFLSSSISISLFMAPLASNNLLYEYLVQYPKFFLGLSCPLNFYLFQLC